MTSAVAPRIKIAGPLLLVAIGLGVSLLPFVPPVQVEPEIILVGILPPLLYSAAVQLPAIEFRRDFGPIAGLSVAARAAELGRPRRSSSTSSSRASASSSRSRSARS